MSHELIHLLRKNNLSNTDETNQVLDHAKKTGNGIYNNILNLNIANEKNMLETIALIRLNSIQCYCSHGGRAVLAGPR